MIEHMIAYGYAGNEIAISYKVMVVEYGFDFLGIDAFCVACDESFFIMGGVIDPYAEKEAVELCFRERVGSLLLDWIACSDDHERFIEVVRYTGYGDLPLSHCLKERHLRLRWGSINFISENEVGKDRAGLKAEYSCAGVLVCLDEFGAEDVGWHHVGSELNACKFEIKRMSEGSDE